MPNLQDGALFGVSATYARRGYVRLGVPAQVGATCTARRDGCIQGIDIHVGATCTACREDGNRVYSMQGWMGIRPKPDLTLVQESPG